MGHPGRCGLAGLEAPMALRGSGLRPAAWDEFGFFGEFNEAAPCGVSLFGFSADLCRAFQRFSALSPGTSMPRLRRFPALRLGVVTRGGGGSGFQGDSGACGLPGMGAPAARLRSGRGPRQGMDSEFYGELSHAAPCGVPLLRLRRIPALRFEEVAPGSGDFWGVFGGIGASTARGQGNACSAAVEWAGPTAGERAGGRGRGWVRGFFGEFNQDVPSGASMPSRCPRGAEGGVLVGVAVVPRAFPGKGVAVA